MNPLDSRLHPGFQDKITNPMDLSTVSKRLEAGEYNVETSKFLQDLRLIFDNARMCYPQGSDMYENAGMLKELSERKFRYKFVWSNKHIQERKEASALRAKIRAQLQASNNANSSSGNNNNDATASKDVSVIPPSSSSASLLSSPPFQSPNVKRPKLKPVSTKAVKARVILINEIKEENLDQEYLKYLSSSDSHTDYSQMSSSQSVSAIRQTNSVVPDVLNTGPEDQINQQLIEDQLAKDNEIETMEVETPETLESTNTIDHVKSVVSKGVLSRIYRQKKPRSMFSKHASVNATNVQSKTSSNAPLVLSEKGAEELLKALNTPQGVNHEMIKKKAYPIARTCLVKTVVPYYTEGYAVFDFGLLPFSSLNFYHNRDFLFPEGYTCHRSLRLYMVPKVEATHQDGGKRVIQSSSRFINVPFISKIESHNGSPIFKVYVGDATFVSESRLPQIAWANALVEKHRLLVVLTGKLERCRAVFNRLCVDSMATIYLEHKPFYPSQSDVYNSAPMWLREIHRKLVEGVYENEYEFFFDMLLAFGENSYISHSSRLVYLFEILFTEWVLNVVEPSIYDFAKGPWNKWDHLRYFDSTSDQDHVCVATGTQTSELICCASCEDNYSKEFLLSSNQLTNDDDDDDRIWVCERCRSLAQVSEYDSKYKASGDEISSMTRAAGLPEGWLKAKPPSDSKSIVTLFGVTIYMKDVVKQKRKEDAMKSIAYLNIVKDYCIKPDKEKSVPANRPDTKRYLQSLNIEVGDIGDNLNKAVKSILNGLISNIENPLPSLSELQKYKDNTPLPK